MKKRNLIFTAVIITISLLAFSMTTKDNQESSTIKDITFNTTVNEIKKLDEVTEFDFSVGPRQEPITLSKLNSATSISDFISPKSFNSIIDLKLVKVTIIENGRQTNKQEFGYTKTLTAKQLQLLKATDYSLQFNIRSEFTALNTETGLIEDTFDSPHYSVEPEKLASYPKGEASFIEYLIDNTIAERTNLNQKKLLPAMLKFTVNKNGNVINSKFGRSSNNKILDAKIIKLINNLPGWIPAENAKGIKVNQELVVRFYVKGMGC